MIPRARLDSVTEADIHNLIDHSVRESRALDYKRDWPSDRDGRAELAKDVCAFANSLGGWGRCKNDPPRRSKPDPPGGSKMAAFCRRC